MRLESLPPKPDSRHTSPGRQEAPRRSNRQPRQRPEHRPRASARAGAPGVALGGDGGQKTKRDGHTARGDVRLCSTWDGIPPHRSVFPHQATGVTTRWVRAGGAWPARWCTPPHTISPPLHSSSAAVAAAVTGLARERCWAAALGGGTLANQGRSCTCGGSYVMKSRAPRAQS